MSKMLFIGVGYYNYDQHILEAFKKKGYEVDYITDRPANFMLYKTLLGDFCFKNYEKIYLHNIIKSIKDCNYELIVVVVGHFLTKDFLEKLKQKNNAKFILYLWDNVARIPNYDKTKQFYDKIYSFDLADCQRYGFDFLPLFYLENQADYNISDNDYDYLVYSAMVNHSERYKILKKILKKYQSEPMLFYLVIGRKNGLIRKLFKKYKFDFFDKRLFYCVKSIPEKQNYDSSMRAKSILDVQYFGQTGLTMRTIETLGSSKKLITTNKTIKYYDFYNPQNIQIINQSEVDIDIPLLKSDYEKIPKEILDKYSIDSWASSLLGLEKKTYLKDAYNLLTIKL